MADLKTSVQFIHGIGPQRAKALEKLGIATLGDLISWFPRRYEDRTQIVPIAQLDPDTPACVAAMIAAPPTLSHIRKGMDLVKVRAVDDTGALDVTFFNQSWLKNQLRVGETYTFYGRAEGSLLRKSMASPIVEPEGRREHTGRIVPIYSPSLPGSASCCCPGPSGRVWTAAPIFCRTACRTASVRRISCAG